METTDHLIDRGRFLEMLNNRFPAIYADIDEIDDGLLHLEMGAFSIATRQAIEKMNWAEVSHHFEFINEVLSRGNGDIRNAVHVSYLENVFIGEGSPSFSQARGMLPPALNTSLVELEEHFDMLAEMSEGR